MCTDFTAITSCIGLIIGYLNAINLTNKINPFPRLAKLPTQRELLGPASDDTRRAWLAWNKVQAEISALQEGRTRLACTTCPNPSRCPELSAQPSRPQATDVFPCVQNQTNLNLQDEAIALLSNIASILWSLVQAELSKQFIDDRGSKMIIDGPEWNVYLIPR